MKYLFLRLEFTFSGIFLHAINADLVLGINEEIQNRWKADLTSSSSSSSIVT